MCYPQRERLQLVHKRVVDPVVGQIPLIGGDNHWWKHEVTEALPHWRWRIEGTRFKSVTDNDIARQNITEL